MREPSNNQFDANGWSKYQLMVLQQLEDHTRVLQNLNKDIIAINQALAVQQAETAMWKNQITLALKELRDEVDEILYDEKGIGQRIVTVERELDVEEQANIKIKAIWAVYGSIIAVIANAVVHFVATYFKK
jgi:hypothetical protein